jgi:hypothetical protein
MSYHVPEDGVPQKNTSDVRGRLTPAIANPDTFWSDAAYAGNAAWGSAKDAELADDNRAFGVDPDDE